MSSKTKFILIGAAIVVLVAVVTAVGVIREKKQDLSSSGSEAVGANSVAAGANSAGAELKSGEATSQGSLGALETARFVAERFASFSSEADFNNIESLYSFFAPDFLSWAEDYVKKGKSETPGENYRVVSRVLTVESEKIDDTEASFLLRLQRQEQRGQEESKVSLRDLTVELVKTDGAWLIDRLKWEP